MSAQSRARFAEVVRRDPVDVALAALLVAVEAEPDLDVADSLAELDRRAEELAPLVLAHPPAEALLRGLAGFHGSDADFADLRSSLLPHVLRRRRGLPLLLCVVWVEIARRLGVPAAYAAAPGRVVLVLADGTVLDAFAGARLTGVPVEPLPEPALLLRLLTNIRAWAARQPPSLDAARTRLWAVELSLLLPGHPAALRRERGELTVRLGGFAEGAADLEVYADLVEDLDGATARACRAEARQARARLS